MSSFLICESGATPQRRGRAHEEAVCRQIMLKTNPSLAWLIEAGVTQDVDRVLASPLGGTHKADIFFRASGPARTMAGRLSVKMCCPSGFDITQGYRNHLHGCGAGSSETFGLIPRSEEDNEAVRKCMLRWQTGESIMSMSLSERSLIEEWLASRWEILCEKFLFGAFGAPGYGAVEAIVCTIAKPSKGRLFSDRSVAMNRETFRRLHLYRTRTPTFLDACGGCFSDGIIAVQARGSQTTGLQAKLNMDQLIKDLDKLSPSTPHS